MREFHRAYPELKQRYIGSTLGDQRLFRRIWRFSPKLFDRVFEFMESETAEQSTDGQKTAPGVQPRLYARTAGTSVTDGW